MSVWLHIVDNNEKKRQPVASLLNIKENGEGKNKCDSFLPFIAFCLFVYY